jgi:hypothetical protein
MKGQGMVYVIDKIRVTHRDKNGKIIRDRWLNQGLWHRFLVRLGLAHNTVTWNGFAAVASRIGYNGTNVGNLTANATNQAPFVCIGIGTGTTASNVNDTQLQTSLAINSSGVTISFTTTNYTNDTLQLVHVFSAANDSLTNSSNVTEVGQFNGTVNGTAIMLLHQVFSPADYCNWANGDTESITIQLKCEQGS